MRRPLDMNFGRVFLPSLQALKSVDTCTATGPNTSSKCLQFRLSVDSPLGEAIPRNAMADPKNFLDNLNNLRLVTSVALEHIQANLTNFVRDANANQMRECDRSINQIRTLAEQLEREFNTLEYLLGKRTTRSN